MFLKKEWSSEINLDYTWTSIETSFKYSMMDRGQEGCDNCGTKELHASSSPSRLRAKRNLRQEFTGLQPVGGLLQDPERFSRAS